MVRFETSRAPYTLAPLRVARTPTTRRVERPPARRGSDRAPAACRAGAERRSCVRPRAAGRSGSARCRMSQARNPRRSGLLRVLRDPASDPLEAGHGEEDPAWRGRAWPLRREASALARASCAQDLRRSPVALMGRRPVPRTWSGSMRMQPPPQRRTRPRRPREGFASPPPWISPPRARGGRRCRARPRAGRPRGGERGPLHPSLARLRAPSPGSAGSDGSPPLGRAGRRRSAPV